MIYQGSFTTEWPVEMRKGMCYLSHVVASLCACIDNAHCPGHAVERNVLLTDRATLSPPPLIPVWPLFPYLWPAPPPLSHAVAISVRSPRIAPGNEEFYHSSIPALSHFSTQLTRIWPSTTRYFWWQTCGSKFCTLSLSLSLCLDISRIQYSHKLDSYWLLLEGLPIHWRKWELDNVRNWEIFLIYPFAFLHHNFIVFPRLSLLTAGTTIISSTFSDYGWLSSASYGWNRNLSTEGCTFISISLIINCIFRPSLFLEMIV